MSNVSRLTLVSISTLAAVLASSGAHATNGLSMEGYGAKSGAMGGAAMAQEVGNSAVMSNPATLSLLKDGQRRFGLGMTILGPDVESTGPAAFGSPSTESDGTSYLLPSISYMKKAGPYTYGAAILAQGGMGTEYGSATQGDLFFAGQTAFGASDPDGMGAGIAMLSGNEVRSEVGFGRLMAPLAFQVNNKLSIAGQVDFVWAGMDIQLDMDGATFAGMAGLNPGITTDFGSATGSMITAFQGAAGAGQVSDVSWARFDFSNSDDFTGEATGYGFGAKLGFLYQANNQLSIGGVYHSKTNISDLETSNATVSFDGTGVAFGGGAIGVTGDIDVVDFQWPATLGFGVGYKLNDKITLAGDIRHLAWSDSMENFTMEFTADANQANPAAAGFAGTKLKATLKQEWDDQTVISLGGQYQASPQLMLRAGVNLSDNPVPDNYLNPLFPAIIEKHYTAGFGYRVNDSHQFSGAVAIAPEVEATNSQNGVESTHSQLTWRANYVFRY